MFDPKIDLQQLKRFQREIRKVIRQSRLSRAHRAVLLAIVDMWWGKNKTANTARGLGLNLTPIHPGMTKIAKRSGVSIRSANYAFSVLKRLKIVSVVDCGNGGKHAAKFVVCFHHVLALDGLSKEDIKGCHFAGVTPANFADGNKGNTGNTDGRHSAQVIPFRKNPVKERPL